MLAQRVYQYAKNHAQNSKKAVSDPQNLLAEVLMKCENPQPEGYQGPQVEK